MERNASLTETPVATSEAIAEDASKESSGEADRRGSLTMLERYQRLKTGGTENLPNGGRPTAQSSRDATTRQSQTSTSGTEMGSLYRRYAALRGWQWEVNKTTQELAQRTLHVIAEETENEKQDIIHQPVVSSEARDRDLYNLYDLNKQWLESIQNEIRPGPLDVRDECSSNECLSETHSDQMPPRSGRSTSRQNQDAPQAISVDEGPSSGSWQSNDANRLLEMARNGDFSDLLQALQALRLQQRVAPDNWEGAPSDYWGAMESFISEWTDFTTRQSLMIHKHHTSGVAIVPTIGSSFTTCDRWYQDLSDVEMQTFRVQHLSSEERPQFSCWQPVVSERPLLTEDSSEVRQRSTNRYVVLVTRRAQEQIQRPHHLQSTTESGRESQDILRICGLIRRLIRSMHQTREVVDISIAGRNLAEERLQRRECRFGFCQLLKRMQRALTTKRRHVHETVDGQEGTDTFRCVTRRSFKKLVGEEETENQGAEQSNGTSLSAPEMTPSQLGFKDSEITEGASSSSTDPAGTPASSRRNNIVSHQNGTRRQSRGAMHSASSSDTSSHRQSSEQHASNDPLSLSERLAFLRPSIANRAVAQRHQASLNGVGLSESGVIQRIGPFPRRYSSQLLHHSYTPCVHRSQLVRGPLSREEQSFYENYIGCWILDKAHSDHIEGYVRFMGLLGNSCPRPDSMNIHLDDLHIRVCMDMNGLGFIDEKRPWTGGKVPNDRRDQRPGGADCWVERYPQGIILRSSWKDPDAADVYEYLELTSDFMHLVARQDVFKENEEICQRRTVWDRQLA